MAYLYLHVGSAADLKGRDRRLYRALEILPGALAWATLIGVVVLSWQLPVIAAIFIILFDLYWLVKTIFLSAHLRANWRRMRHHLEIDWEERLINTRWDHIWQLVIIPFAREPREIVEEAVENILQSQWPKERMILVMASEEAVGEEARIIADHIRRRYERRLGAFFVTAHPAGLSGEISGKGSNETWALNQSLGFIQSFALNPENVLVSSFDVDTRVPSQYFLCLTWHFLTAEHSHRSSFQPVPLYHNNIWEAPALSRVVAMSGAFWQMMQQERPERLTTFSSHSMSLKSLMEVGGWQKNIVSEDSRIFWNHYLFYNGDYRTVPLSFPVYMDANIGKTFWQTIKQVYKQQRRWGWGVENVPYVLFGFSKQPFFPPVSHMLRRTSKATKGAKRIPLRKRLYYAFTLLEGFWSWATNALIIFLLGWLPLLIGGETFNQTILSYNLPRITRVIVTLAMIGLVASAIISISLLLAIPEADTKKRRWWQWGTMALQWILVPITILFFGALPGLEAQTRLMFGGRFRLGFWLTPKHRK